MIVCPGTQVRHLLVSLPVVTHLVRAHADSVLVEADEAAVTAYATFLEEGMVQGRRVVEVYPWLEDYPSLRKETNGAHVK